MVSFAAEIGVDLGTSNLVIASKDKGIMFSEPAVVAQCRKTGEVLGIGRQALNAAADGPGSVMLLSPLQGGYIADYEAAEILLAKAFAKIGALRLGLKPRVYVTIPCKSTSVETRALVQSIYEAGAKKVDIIPSVIAAAYGAGLDPYSPEGCLVIHLGGGCTDIAIISLGEIICSDTLKFGGEFINAQLINLMRNRYGYDIGRFAAEKLKLAATCRETSAAAEVKVTGIKVASGLPETFIVTKAEILEAISNLFSELVDAIRLVLKQAGPELSADVILKGAVFTGGTSQIPGITRLVANELGMPAVIAEDPIHAAGRGLEFVMADSSLVNNWFKQVSGLLVAK